MKSRPPAKRWTISCCFSRKSRQKRVINWTRWPLVLERAAGAALARVLATRRMGGFPEGWAPVNYPGKWAPLCYRFCWRRPESRGAERRIEPVITLSSGEAKQVRSSTSSRLTAIVFSLTGIRLQIHRSGGDAHSCAAVATPQRNWLYQYFPPAADRRNYVDDRIMK